MIIKGKHFNCGLLAAVAAAFFSVSSIKCEAASGDMAYDQQVINIDHEAYDQLLAHEHVPGQIILTFNTKLSVEILLGRSSVRKFLSNLAVEKIECLTPSYFEGGLHPDVYQRMRISYLVTLKNKDDSELSKAIVACGTGENVAASPNYINGVADAAPLEYPYHQYQWAITDNAGIDAYRAWYNFSTGSIRTKIAVFDTGVLPHDDLYINSRLSYTASSEKYGESCHGTHVAGICGARADDDERGMKGVCQGADIVDFKISDKHFIENSEEENGGHYVDYGNDSHVIAAIDRINGLWGTSDEIDVINYSFSGFGTSCGDSSSPDMVVTGSSNKTSILWAIKSFPGTFVWSAGNEHQCVMDEDYRFCPNLISVGSYDSDGEISAFSNYGDAVSIFAPGGDIISTVENNKYESWNGTSMAAPHVAGAAALIYHCFPRISATLVKKAITESVTSIRTPRKAYYYKYDENGNETQYTKSSGSYEYIKKLNLYLALQKAAEFYKAAAEDKNPLRLEMLDCRGRTWKILIRNQSRSIINVKYSFKSMSTDNATNYKPDASAKMITLGPLESRMVSINDNDINFACAASVCEANEDSAGRYVSYLYRNFWDTGSQERFPLFTENRYYSIIDDYVSASKLSPLKFNVVGSRINWFVRDWNIEIVNAVGKGVNVTYNANMCFFEDGKKWTNLRDLKTIRLGANASSSKIWINANGTADSIVMSYQYRDKYDCPKRLITVANGISGKGSYKGSNFTIDA